MTWGRRQVSTFVDESPSKLSKKIIPISFEHLKKISNFAKFDECGSKLATIISILKFKGHGRLDS